MQHRKRVTSSRSFSSPPNFALETRRGDPRSRVAEGAPERDTEADGAEEKAVPAVPAVGANVAGGKPRPHDGVVGAIDDRAGRGQPAKREPPAEPWEAELPCEDFVEGGVELSPSEGGGIVREDLSPPRPTRPLPLLGDQSLHEFWPPSGEGVRAVFLDYDGTLREFEATPELATPTPELEELLEELNARKDFAPHIISGRDARFLEACFSKYNRFTLIAEHGFQIWRPGTEGWELTDHPDGLDRYHDDWKAIVRTTMSSFVDAIPQSHIEEKNSSLVWHYRQSPNQARATAYAEEALAKLERLRDKEKIHKIRVSHGHKVVEVSYRKVRKGPVMRRVCEEQATYGTPFLSVLVAGDDVSDESMFDASPHDFLTIKVGSSDRTAAKFRVETPAQLREFLRKLLR